MIIDITGTPGTGKDTISKILSKKLGFKLIDLNKLAKERGFIKGYDEKRKCDIVDIGKVNKEIKKFRKSLIIQSHYSHELCSDLVIVLRTDTKELRKRLEKRKWPEEKIKENLEAEIFEICKDEALQKTKKVFEIDTTSESSDKLADRALNIIFREGIEIRKNLKLPERLLKYFKKPYGHSFSSVEEFLKSNLKPTDRGLLISVGDMSSFTLTQRGVKPNIIVIDNKVNRKPFKEKIKFQGKRLKVINVPGTISRSLWGTIRQAVKSGEKVKISVIGEEDLAVLPAVIMAPLGSLVLYGQPNVKANGEIAEEGLIAVIVDLEKKKDALKLLQKMVKMQ